jgi:serine/threonine protein kinase
MNTEALIGQTLGTCILQQLIGQGGMGAVYLAQQSRPRRQVAVKVLLPVHPLSPQQRTAFLELFRRETDAAASLVHPNIMPVHEYGEGSGLAYLVMPYISAGTLRDELDQSGALPLARIMNYLEQLAAAIDFAHARGVIHRDIKPANILKTSEGRLLLSDFGLVKVITDSQGGPQMRITGATGMPIGTPDYMAPEQGMGAEINSRADLYSLGIVLYQMVTGVVPFRGEMPMQIAMQHLHMPPPSPRILRPDLPVVAERALLQTLAKQPQERYACAMDLAMAFRQALENAGVQLDQSAVNPATMNDTTSGFKKRGLFDPMWQQNSDPETSRTTSTRIPRKFTPLPLSNTTTGLSNTTNTTTTGLSSSRLSSFSAKPQPADPNTGPGFPAQQLPRTTRQLPPAPQWSPAAQQPPAFGTSALPPAGSPTRVLGDPQGQPTTALAPLNQQQTGMLPNAGNTGLLVPSDTETGATSTMKLTQSVKIVQIPVAGEPGRYMTGFMPIVKAPPQQTTRLEEPKTFKNTLQKNIYTVIAVTVVALLILGTTAFLVMRNQPQIANKGKGVTATPNATATQLAQATAAAQDNIILNDPLKDNISNWPVKNDGSPTYQFKDGEYHLAVPSKGNVAFAIYPNQTFDKQLGLKITLWEVKRDDKQLLNWYGVFVRYSEKKKDNKTYQTFYAFGIAPKENKYWFRKYDGSITPNDKFVSEPWGKPIGDEFHKGLGPENKNTVRITMDGDKFTFFVNDKEVGKATDNAYPDGSIGMIVNQVGNEVAYSNLLLTKN